MPPKPPIPGQESLEVGAGNEPTLEASPQLDLDRLRSVSGVILDLSRSRSISPDSVTHSDFESLTPEKITEGLYVPEGKWDRDYSRARNGVIFAPEEFTVISISPIRIARKAGNDYVKKNSSLLDKDRLAEGEARESAAALDKMIEKATNLSGSLTRQEEVLDKVLAELMGARGTGYFAHMSAMDMKLMVTEAEMAIRKMIEVTAQTKGWSRRTLERAYATVSYQLFGDHPQRFAYWKKYAPVAGIYAANKRKVVDLSLDALQKERANFPYHEE